MTVHFNLLTRSTSVVLFAISLLLTAATLNSVLAVAHTTLVG
jgi:hypothetical protein